MLEVADALALVLAQTTSLPPQQIHVAEALGFVLAEAVTSDIDSPPYDKSMVDGYAVRAADFSGGRADLRVLEEVVAGALPTQPVLAGACTRIMTGAPIPSGADAVVMLERTQATDKVTGRVSLFDERLRNGQNIMRRATSLRRGDVVLQPGVLLGPAHMGVLAEVGRGAVQVLPAPTVAILSTGNELVPPDQTPQGSQIRNSNGPMLAAAVRQAGAKAVELGVARDDANEVRKKIEIGLQSDVLLISGGVSAGVLDLVPGVLRELGVEQAFHKVRLKPGKPLWFGRKASSGGPRTLVFGLPGNPVSSLVCFRVFAVPALRKLSGKQVVLDQPMHAALAEEFTHRGDRPTYHPAIVTRSASDSLPNARPLDWAGSADLSGFSAANALILFPAGDRQYARGEQVAVMPLDV